MNQRRLIPAAAVERWDEAVDVLVAGAGCAGLCAAIEAARSGARTLVLERAGGAGGTSALSGGVIYCGGGTAIQKACGFEDSVEAMRGYLLAASGFGPDEEKIDLYCSGSVGHFDWLVSLGVPFKPSYWPHNCEPWTDDCLYYSGSEACHPFSSMAAPAPRGHTVRAEGSCAGGRVLVERLADAARTSGVRLLTDAVCRSLVAADDGRIVGAAVRHDGEMRFLRAMRGVVLATGGFIMNRDMVALYAPQASPLQALGNPWDDGTGMRLGEAAGGALINMHAVACTCPVLLPAGLIRGILLDRHAQRFVNEDVNHKKIGECSVLQHGGRIYLLVDSEVYEQPAMKLPVVATGDSAAELEAELGWPRHSIERTLDLYNHYAARGVDPLFGKRREFLEPLTTPPYAVFDCSVEATGVYGAFTLGGLRTRVTGEVLTGDGDEVPGLYAVGRATSCLSAQSCITSGLQLGEGTFFGRLSGRTAAYAI